MSAYDADGDSVLDQQAVVIDNGSGIMKVGRSGEERPSIRIPSIVGSPKYPQMLGDPQSGNTKYIGDNLQKYKGVIRLNYPMKHGVMTKDSEDDMLRLWEHAYEKLGLQASEQPVMLTEAPNNPMENRAKMAEIFFDKLSAPALWVAPQALLTLYATGRVTGIVLDSGHGVTHGFPVFEGFGLPHAITRMNLAGSDVTDYFNLMLKKEGFNFDTTSELNMVQKMKEKMCAVMPKDAQLKDQPFKGKKYDLPDGSQIQPGSAIYKATEILFDPSLIGKEYRGAHNIVTDAIAKSDIDIRRTLYQHVVLSGGTTMHSGFGERLLDELKASAPPQVKIRIYAPEERNLSTWIGASIMSSLSSFRSMWITKRERQESGRSILYRKSFV